MSELKITPDEHIRLECAKMSVMSLTQNKIEKKEYLPLAENLYGFVKGQAGLAGSEVKQPTPEKNPTG